MTEQEGNKFDVNQTAISRFREILDLIPTPGAQSMRDLIKEGLIVLTTNEEANRVMRKNRSSGVGFSVCFDPKTWSAKAMVTIDADVFVSKGPFSLGGKVRDMLEKFEAAKIFADEKEFNWQKLENSEVETFLREIESGGGRDYEVLDLS